MNGRDEPISDLKEAIQAIPCNGANLILRSRTLGEALPDEVIEHIIEICEQQKKKR